MEKTENLSLEKLNEAVKNLSEIDSSYDDYFELLAILVDDIADMYKAKDSKAFTHQKSDARKTLKIVKRRLDNATFKMLKIKTSIKEK